MSRGGGWAGLMPDNHMSLMRAAVSFMAALPLPFPTFSVVPGRGPGRRTIDTFTRRACRSCYRRAHHGRREALRYGRQALLGRLRVENGLAIAAAFRRVG